MLKRQDILDDTKLRSIFKRETKPNEFYQNIDENGKRQDTKQRFIDITYPDKEEEESQRYQLKLLFNGTASTEKKFHKDIYEFGVDEIERLLYSFQSASVSSLQVRISLLKSYVEFCIRHGIRSNPINFFEGLDAMKYVAKSTWKYKYVTKERLLDICSLLPSSQLASILILAFFDIIGKETYEMRHLKEEDIDVENCEITVREYEEINRKTGEVKTHPERIVKIDKEFMPYIQRAKDSTVIKAPNTSRNSRETHYYTLAPNNPYLIKRTISQINETDDPSDTTPITNGGLRSRIILIKENFQGEPWLINKLTLTGLEQSGMIEKLRKIERQNGEVTTEDYINLMIEYRKQPNSRFNIQKTYEEMRKDEELEKQMQELEQSLEDEF